MSDDVVFDDDNPEWTAEDFKSAKPAIMLPPEVLANFPRTRGAQKTDTKVPVSIRLSREVVDHFRSGGPGWQSRIDAVLKAAIRK